MENQTQSKPNKLEANLAEIPTGELLGIHKPGTNQTQPVVSLSNLLQTNHPIFQNFPQKPLISTYFPTFFSIAPLFASL